MRPVAPNPQIPLETLLDELLGFDGEAQQKAHLEQILAKLQRKARGLDAQEGVAFAILAKGRSVQGFLSDLAQAGLTDAIADLRANRKALAFLDENRERARRQLISHHEDELLSHTRGYGEGEKPQEYLDAFKSFILDNLNQIPALAIVCQRPRELTRQALKELKLELDRHRFNEITLRTAWRELTNEDIAADIISFIRRQALGDPLLSHQERIRQAMQRVRALHRWSAVQRRWLERIEKQLVQESVFEREDFDKGAFQAHGGWDRLNKTFVGRLDRVLAEINEALYPQKAGYG